MVANTVDLRSDLLSRPSPAMLAAMQAAAAEPPAFGLREDPRVARLEATAAQILGKEDALFCPTCTMCNQIAINLQTSPGETLVAEASSHVITSEGGAPAALSGVMIDAIAGADGMMSVSAVHRALRFGASDSRPRSALLVIENTHTRSGGTVMDLQAMRALQAAAADNNARVHLDGARLFNAADTLGCEASDLAACADTVAISLNKGLGAPLGAILAGERDLIARAVVVRQRFGGGWRPAGVLAAAGFVALTQMRARLSQDHERAQRFAKEIDGVGGLAVVNAPVQTNLVLVAPDERLGACDEWLRRLAAKGVLALSFAGRLRFAFHNGIDDEGVSRASSAMRALAA